MPDGLRAARQRAVRWQCCGGHWWNECDPANADDPDGNYTGPCCGRCTHHQVIGLQAAGGGSHPMFDDDVKESAR